MNASRISNLFPFVSYIFKGKRYWKMHTVYLACIRNMWQILNDNDALLRACFENQERGQMQAAEG